MKPEDLIGQAFKVQIKDGKIVRFDPIKKKRKIYSETLREWLAKQGYLK